jgi:hypothetical protein
MVKHPKRPRDSISLAKMVGDIATGQLAESSPAPNPATEHARKGGLKGGKARAEALTPRQRAEIAKVAAEARWKKS